MGSTQSGILDVTVKVVTDFRKIQQKADRDEARALRRAGAIGRGIYRRSIRKTKKKNSRPNEAIKTHKSNGAKNLIRYAVSGSTVYVGMMPGKDNFDPGALEHGSTALIRTDRATRRKTGKRRIRAKIRKRPTAAKAMGTFLKSYSDRPWVTR